MARTKVIILKTQPHAVNTCWKRVSQRSLKYKTQILVSQKYFYLKVGRDPPIEKKSNLKWLTLDRFARNIVFNVTDQQLQFVRLSVTRRGKSSKVSFYMKCLWKLSKSNLGFASFEKGQLQYTLTARCRFHQHFTSFFVQTSFAQLFCAYNLCCFLIFFAKAARKMLVKLAKLRLGLRQRFSTQITPRPVFYHNLQFLGRG